MVQPFWKTVYAIFQYFLQIPHPSALFLGIQAEEINIYAHMKLIHGVQNSFIYNHHKLDATRMSFPDRMVKHTVITATLWNTT